MSSCSLPSLPECLKCIESHNADLKNKIKKDRYFLRRTNSTHNTNLLIVIILIVFVILSYVMVILFKRN